MTFFTSAAEPLTRVLRVVLEPEGVGTSSPVPKKAFKIERAYVEMSTKPTIDRAEKAHNEYVLCQDEGCNIHP